MGKIKIADIFQRTNLNKVQGKIDKSICFSPTENIF